MNRPWKIWVATTAAFAVAALFTADAQALVRHSHRHVAHGGAVIVHTGRSYLDPGASATVGSENHYFSDTAPYSLSGLGPTFSSNSAGFQLLPTRFNPPGRSEPLFQF